MMKKEAVFHINMEDFIYPVSRNEIVIKMKAAAGDVKKCQVIYWSRDNEENKKQKILGWIGSDGIFDYFQAHLQFSKVARYQKYYFCLEDKHDNMWYYNSFGISKMAPADGFFEYLYANKNDVALPPEWAKGIIYYQIFPERFCDGNPMNNPVGCETWGTLPTRDNYMGGDLEGIIEKIPYLVDLGIECLYLTPIFKGDFNHKYATTDYFHIDPMFGTNEIFADVVKKCHENGIRILLDGVFNHTGIHFAPFEDVLKNGEKSKYKDWFLIKKYPVNISHHDYECVGAYKWMPKLNSSNSEVQQFILSVMEFWIKEYGIDGWRLDVSDEVDMTVWQRARTYLKEKYPQIILLGETWGYGGKLVTGNRLDSVMNYLFRDAVRDYFGYEKISTSEFAQRINHMLSMYKQETNQVLYNLLDSHDTERFLYYCNEDYERFKLAIAFQMLFMGSPAIFYGDEVGISADNDPDCRRCMIWAENSTFEIKNWYKKMIEMRKNLRPIKQGNFKTILIDNDKDILGFLRQIDEENIYVFIHKGRNTEQINCPVLDCTKTYIELLGKKEYLCECTENFSVFENADQMKYEGIFRMEMEPYSVKILIEGEDKL